MYQTYQNLRPLANNCKNSGSELVQAYREHQSPVDFSKLFCDNIGLITRLSSKFFTINSQDAVSFALEELHTCAMNFKEELGSFISYFGLSYSSRLKWEVQRTNCQKRPQDLIALDEIIQAIQEVDYTEAEFLSSISETQMTENERAYCSYVLVENNLRDSDFAKQVGITKPAVNQLKKSLQKKLGQILLPA